MTSERTCHFTGDDAWKCGTSCTCQHFNWNNKGQAAMTSELRPAVEVWDDAIAAWAADTIDTRQAAAAVIEAYGDEREAKGREEQAAELAKFKALAETLAGAGAAIIKLIGPKDARLYASDPEVIAMSNALREYKEARDEAPSL